MDQNEMSNLNRGSSIDASYQVSYHLAKRLQRKSYFRNWPIRNKTCLCILPCFGSFGQAVSEKIFKIRPIRHRNYLWQPCLLSDRNEISNRNRGLSIDSSYQVSVHLVKQILPTKFQYIWPNGFRGEEFFKSSNQKKESPVVAMFVNGSGRTEQSL